jgi:hypothetical protein
VDNVVYKRIDNAMRSKTPLDVQFLSVRYAKQINQFAMNEPIEFIFEIKANNDVANFNWKATIFTMDDMPIGSVLNTTSLSIKNGEIKTTRFSLSDYNLVLGGYYVSFILWAGQTIFDFIPQILSFEINQYMEDPNVTFVQWYKNWGNILFKSETSMIE